jgi:hypothetical protein
MIRRTVLLLTLAVVSPALAQPPAPPAAVPARPSVVQFDPAQSSDQQGGQRGFGRRNRGDGQGFGGRGRGQFGAQAQGGTGAAVPAQASVSSVPALPNPPVALQGRGPVARPAGPPAPPADALVMRSLQGSISAVFDPGAKAARIKLIETDDHGVEGLRTLKPGDLYRDGWRLGAVTATEATLRKGKGILHVDITRGWPAQPAPIQPAVLVQPITPAGPANGGRGGAPGGFAGPAGRRGPGPAPAAAPGLGLSNARVGGSPPAAQGLQGPNSVISVRANPDGSRTMTTNVNGRTMVVTLPAVQ